jgi:hypothetical protein
MSSTDLKPAMVFDLGRAAVYVTVFVLGLLLSRRDGAKGVYALFGGLIGAYALFAPRVLCDAMWEAVGHDQKVPVVRETTEWVQTVGYMSEVFAQALIVAAVFVGRKRTTSAAKRTTG